MAKLNPKRIAKISAKRQITLPIALCKMANIHAGDEVKIYVDRQGIISLVKMSAGISKGCLKDVVVADKQLSDEESYLRDERT